MQKLDRPDNPMQRLHCAQDPQIPTVALVDLQTLQHPAAKLPVVQIHRVRQAGLTTEPPRILQSGL